MIAHYYRQALGRSHGFSDAWDDQGVSWALKIVRFSKKQWILSLAVTRNGMIRDAEGEFTHRPTLDDTRKWVVEAQAKLLT